MAWQNDGKKKQKSTVKYFIKCGFKKWEMKNSAKLNQTHTLVCASTVQLVWSFF